MSKRGALSGRLSRLKKEGLSPALDRNRKVAEKSTSFGLSSLSGWTEVSPHVWRRSVMLENPLLHEYRGSLMLPEDQKSSQIIFYDTETTGLSTGAGTIPFLIGLGKINKDRFEIIQYFLADYPGEPRMLQAIKEEFEENSLFVSYNGKSYDSHLINTRFLMNGIKSGHRDEVDLLYMSRRLWKSLLVNCRLGTIEEQILSVQRGPDIPGAEIPDVWFDFLKTGTTEKLELVFSHNLQDIHSLSLLLHVIETITKEYPEDISYDRYALGRMLLFYGRTEGIQLLENEFHAGKREAGQFLSLYWKREENWDNAIPLWEKMNKTGCHLFSVEELAKYYEHKLKDYDKAISVLDKMFKGPLPPAGDIKERLLHRKKRLQEKKERS